MSEKEPGYRKDIFGSIGDSSSDERPLIPAATIVLLRKNEAQLEVLMLQKNTGIAFGGMWVFPGGKLDEQDYSDQQDLVEAAKNAAVRETQEETGTILSKDSFVWFSHWTPPPSSPKRFSTWFFAAETDQHDITVDGGEILHHQWINPKEALARHKANEIELAPPTWITLHQLALRNSVQDFLKHTQQGEPLFFRTQLMLNDKNQPVAIWEGDSTYGSNKYTAGEKLHRLTMKKGGFILENNSVDY